MGIKYIFNPFTNKFDAISIEDLSGYVPYTGATTNVDLGINNLTVDTNTLFVDSVNHRVGVGTTSPSKTLQIVGDIRIGANGEEAGGRTISNGGDLTIHANDTSTDGSYSALSLKAGPSGGQGFLRFFTNETEKMRLTPAGFLGIGTITPVYKLDVKGTDVTHAIRSDIGFDIYPVPNAVAPTLINMTAGGSVDVGVHYYAVSYFTALGNTGEGALFSVTVSAPNQTVNLNIPVSSDPRVTSRRIYRTKANGNSYDEYYLATINDNTTATYSDTAADSTLTGAVRVAQTTNSTTKFITMAGVRAMVVDPVQTSFGTSAGGSITTGRFNTFFGSSAGGSVTTAPNNVAIGYNAGVANNGGTNISIGFYAGLNNYGYDNINIGYYNGFFANNGGFNTSVGDYSMGVSGDAKNYSGNTSIGYRVLEAITTGQNNTAIGAWTGTGTRAGSSSIFLGAYAGKYETAGLKLIVDTLDRTTEALGRSSALIYGVINSTPSSQTLSLGGTGNVGIGTISPVYKLDVKGTTAASAIRSDIGFDIYPVPNPTVPTGVATAGAGLEIGNYIYNITYYTALGETNVTTSAAITTTSGNQQITLTIPVSTDPRVTGRKIYRTKVGGYRFSDYALTTIADNTTTTYVDSTPDASLVTGPGAGVFRINSTTKYITKAGVRSMVIDTNLTAFGVGAGNAVTTGGRNSFFGNGTGQANTSGTDNQFFGHGVGVYNTTGGANIAMGYSALSANTSGSSNVALGYDSLFYNQTGNQNVAVGALTMFGASTNSHTGNTAIGYYNMGTITTGSYNVSSGYTSQFKLTSGSYNVSSGYQSLYNNQTGNYNVALGTEALYTATTVHNSIALGYRAGKYETLGYKLFIDGVDRGTEARGRTESLIYGEFSATLANQILSLGGGGNVGIGTTSPQAQLHTTQGRIEGVTTVTDTYNILTTDRNVICNKATPFTVTLPTAVVGQLFNIKNIGAGTVTIEGAGTDTIDGELNQEVIQWECIKLICNAANSWVII